MLARRRTDPQPPRDPIHDAIARRAFELFLARGARHGHDLDDWLQAERDFMRSASPMLRPSADDALTSAVSREVNA